MPMDSNPYAAPGAVVDDVLGFATSELEGRKAPRSKRLDAAVLDGLINVVWLTPFMWGATMWVGVKRGLKPAAPMVVVLLLGTALLLAMIVINCMLIDRYGQTIGKRTLHIAVVRKGGGRIGLSRYIFLRFLPAGLLGVIPLVGKFAWLVDVLLIFGPERRCLHDLIADTIVIDV